LTTKSRNVKVRLFQGWICIRKLERK